MHGWGKDRSYEYVALELDYINEKKKCEELEREIRQLKEQVGNLEEIQRDLIGFFNLVKRFFGEQSSLGGRASTRWFGGDNYEIILPVRNNFAFNYANVKMGIMQASEMLQSVDVQVLLDRAKLPHMMLVSPKGRASYCMSNHMVGRFSKKSLAKYIEFHIAPCLAEKVAELLKNEGAENEL